VTHTPGPWSTFQDPSLRHSVGGATVRICEMWGKDPAFYTAEDEANARLIASAPDLLAALRQLTEYLVAYEGSRFVTQLDAAEAAIAKATNEPTEEKA
jgi:hypothetical protein